LVPSRFPPLPPPSKVDLGGGEIPLGEPFNSYYLRLRFTRAVLSSLSLGFFGFGGRGGGFFFFFLLFCCVFFGVLVFLFFFFFFLGVFFFLFFSLSVFFGVFGWVGLLGCFGFCVFNRAD